MEGEEPPYVNVAASASGVDNAPPAVTSPTSGSITDNSATLGGDVTFLGCSPVIERGIFYSETDGFADGTGTKVSETGAGFLTGPFTLPVTTLSPSTVYYYKAFATNGGGTVYSSQGTFTTLCQVVGDPSTFGSDIWNVYAYNGNSLDLIGTTYRGYYTESALTFDSRDKWGDLLSPSSAPGYLGCPVNNDNFTFVYKRQGFPCGTYQIDLTYQDDDTRLYIDGSQVFEHIGYGYTQTNIWTGNLDASSTVEFRVGEGAGNASGALTFTFTAPEANFSAAPTSTLPENPVVFSDLSTGDVTSRLWTFTGGNPSSSTAQNPVVTYSTPGTYDVSLTVTSCATEYTKTSTGYITVNPLTNPVIFSSSGLFPVPVGVTCIQVEAWGAGGGGTNAGSYGRGGGGGGAYARGVMSVSSGTLAVTVGTGGAEGNDGGNSSVGTILANGGRSNANSNTGGSGGAASSISGNIIASYAGGHGGDGSRFQSNDAGGGGGGSAFTNAVGGNGGNGGNSNSNGGAGGSGTGNGGDGAAADNSPTPQDGSAPGGGGGGRGEDSGTSASGANGQVIFTWVDASDFHISAPSCIATTAQVTVTSTSLADGSYTVTYNTTNPASSDNNATMIFSSGVGTFSTIALTGPSSDITVTGITFTGWSCSTIVSSIVSVHILPTAAISYAEPFCVADAVVKHVTQTGQTGGTYSSTSGLIIDGPTGDITPLGSTPATYIITYSFDDGSCPNSTTTSVTIGEEPIATFSYSAPSFCTNNPADPSPTFTGGGVAGIFSASPGGLSLDPGTGKITLATSTPGLYTVSNTVISDGCTTVHNVQVTILNQPTVNIFYDGDPFCNNVPGTVNITRELTNGTLYANGSYTASPAGLSIVTGNDGGDPLSNAGQINPSASTPGTYTVTYNFTNGVCTNEQTTTVTIHEPPRITEQPVAPAPVCKGDGIATISVAAVDGSLTYQWRKDGIPLTEDLYGIYTGVNSATLTITNPTGLLGSENGSVFDVVVSGSCTPSVTSDGVALSLIESPLVTDIQSVIPAMCSGTGTATVTVTATGDGLMYQWRKNGIPLTEGTTYQNVHSATLSIVNPDISENFAFFDVVVTGTCSGESISGSAGPLMVNPSPDVHDVSGSAISCALNPSSDISLSGSQIGIDYQLRNSADNSDIGAPVPGDGNPITLPTGSITTTTTIIVVGIDPNTLCTTQMAGSAIIAVVPELTNNTISSAPTTCIGSSPDPIMGATPVGGDGDYLYVWQTSSDGIIFVTADGINDNQHYLPDPLTQDTWYRRIITSGPCTSISNSVKITINPLPAQVDVSPALAQFCSSLTLRASNGGDGTIYYQGNVPGAQDTRFAQDTIVVHASGTYYFRAFNRNTGCWGPEGSATVTLTLPPSTLSTTICEGGSGTLISAAACPSAVSLVPNYPGSGANNAGIGSLAWTNPNDITTSGSPYALASDIPSGGGITNYLMATGYNFDIPAEATINGIMVTVNRESSGNAIPYVRDNIVRLIRGGSIVGSNRAKTTTDWPTTMGTIDYGNIIDTWGLTGLTAADINSSNFGVALSATNVATSTYPVVAGTATSSENNNTNSHTITLPAGIQSGDLLLIFWSNRERNGINVPTPNGWTLLYESSSSNEARRICWYKIANGNEGTSITINTYGSNQGIRSAHNSYRIAAGTYEGVPVAGTPATGNSGSPNPPSLVSGFGTTKTLWIAASHSLGASDVTAPASYSNLKQIYSNDVAQASTFYATMATATRELEAASEDPGSFSLSPSEEWVANTVAIQGVSGKRDATVDYIKVTVRYTIDGILNWYTSSVGGTSVQTLSPFNPIGDPEVIAVYPELVNSLTPGTYPFWSECSSVPGCRTLSYFTINPAPDAPVAGSNLYTYDNIEKTAEAIAGVGEIVDWYADEAGGVPIAAPAGTNAGTYSAYAEARNLSTGCTSLTRTLVTLTIQQRPISITVDPGQSKIYGEADPLPFTYSVGGDGLATGDTFDGVLIRTSGETVGNYPVDKGTLTIIEGAVNKEPNYDVTFTSDDFTINQRPITITVDPGQGKIFGEADPASLTYSVTSGSLAAGDSFDGALERAIGETVGTYAIDKGTLTIVEGPDNKEGNYDVTFEPDNFTITLRPITITVDPGQGKIYGEADPAMLTYTLTAGDLAAGDSFDGALERTGGETAGTYLISKGTLTIVEGAVNKEGNYDITFESDDFTITQRPITITVDPGQTKIYGDADPVFTYSVTSGSLASGDSFDGALGRVSGEATGTYAINQGSLTMVEGAVNKEANYAITFESDLFTITQRAITLTVDPGQGKIYGDADPALTFTVTSGSLAAGDSFDGALARAIGESIGTYAIDKGSLTIVEGAVNKEANYIVTFEADDFIITQRSITITVDPGQSKIYGDADPALTFSVTSGSLGAGDAFDGVLIRAIGETVGTYAIDKGTLTIVEGAVNKEANYNVTFEADNFTINLRPITITVDPGQGKVYGNADPALTYSITSGSLAAADSFDGTLERAIGETVGTYAIDKGTLTIIEGAINKEGNYDVTFVPSIFTITQLPVTVTVDPGQTKVYGSVNPASYTFSSSPAVGSTLANGDLVAFTGALTRVSGEDVGSYEIQQGSLDNSNYDITFVPDNFTITALPVTVTADAGQSKTYGSVDPVFSFTSSPAVGSTLANGDLVSFTGALTRVSGEDVGNYAMEQGTLANSNYAITFIPDNFAITALAVTVTADPGQTKVYGDADPLAFTYTSVPTGALPNGEIVSFTGALIRVSGEDVGSYEIQQGTLGNDNYIITYVPDNFTITALPVTVTVDAGQSKVYGSVDPASYTFTSSPAVGTLLSNGQTVSFTGALTRVSGEDVGSYEIQQGTLANANYDITYVPDNFTITALPVTVTVDPGQTKVYGSVNPASYTFSSSPAVGSTLANGDLVAFTGALTRVSGEDVGSYEIQQGSLDNSNYDITFVPDNFTITALPVTVTADAGQSKTYGSVDPVFSFTSSPAVGSTLANGDLVSFTGALTRVSGEDVGNYAMEQGTLANSNYAITFIPDNFAITALAVTVTADPGQTKVYGDADPLAFTYTSVPTGALPNGEIVSFTGALIRVSGEDVGSYEIQQGTLGNDNYIITYVPDNFTITALPVTVTVDAGQSKVYGSVDPASYTFTSSPAVGTLLSNGQTVSFTGALMRVSGEDVGSYEIQQGTLANANYDITYVPDNFTITALPVTVTVDPGQTKVYGSVNPASYTFSSSPAVGSTLANGDLVAFTGALTRVAGEDVGSYAIQQGSLDNSNYIITFVPANFAITALPVTVTADAGQTKVYGSADPLAFTYVSVPTGVLPNGETVSFTGALTRVAGEDVGSYAIQQGTLANSNYTISFVPATFTITPLSVTVTANAGQTKVYGSTNPLAYTYTSNPSGVLSNGETISFTGALTRVTGEDVGSYEIQVGTLANANYDITFVPANFTITQLTVTVTATAGQTKVYGAADPLAYTYTSVPTGLLPNGETVSFTGVLSRVAGENIGNYAIQQGTLGNTNYNIIFVSNNFTITPLAVTVTATGGQTKIYGNADPGSFAFTSVPALGAVLPNGLTVSFNGALSRASGENVGAYAIQLGTLANNNYTITFISSNFTITARQVTVTANTQTKVYGEADPVLTYQITAGSLIGTDAFSGALTRVPGENVGTYAILQGTLTLGGNYSISYVGANLSIIARAVTVTADAQTKIYGAPEPALTYRITSGSLAGTDAFTGALTRDPGQNIGTYAIRQGTLALNANYTLTYIGANLTITTRAITVTANAQTKVYGTVDPALTYAITSGSLAGTDAFTGTLTRDAGENVGLYPIRQGTLALTSNYVLTFVSSSLEITIRSITVTADTKTKMYGDPDPVLTYQITSGSLAGNGDAFSGSLTRDAGEDVGVYSITQGTLTLSSNYDLTFIGANLTIGARAITVTADDATRIYGDADNLTYQITSGTLVGTDAFTGSLAHDGGEDVGTYDITLGTLALNGNYNLTFIGATLTITPRFVTVTADMLSKIYGDSDPMLTYTVSSGSLAAGDMFSGALLREAGENIGDYTVHQGDLALNSNYVMTFVEGTFTITPRAITVTADPQTKIYGDPDPELTYQITSGTFAGNGDAFSGNLVRDEGEDVGTYAINQGTLSLNDNYVLTFIGANLTIQRSSVAITVTADSRSKVYGEADPDLTYQITTGELVGSDAFTGALTREPGENAGTYAILQGTLTLSNNYTLIYEGADFTIMPRHDNNHR